MKDFFNRLNSNSNERIAIGILGAIIVLGLVVIPAVRMATHHFHHDMPGTVHPLYPYEPVSGGPDQNSIPGDPGTSDTPSLPDIAQQMDAEAALSSEVAAVLVGMSEADAAVLAEENGRTIRVGSRDGEHFALTMDYRPNRITVDIVNGVVVGTTVG